MEKESIKQFFMNNFDCYAETERRSTIIPAMTADKFIWAVEKLLKQSFIEEEKEFAWEWYIKKTKKEYASVAFPL